MSVLPILSAGLVMTFVAILFVICAVCLILIVLIQKGRGGGLTGALGGGMASGVLGSKTGDFLTWVTIILAGVFLFMAALLAKFYKPQAGDYGTQQTTIQQTAVPETTSTTAAQEESTGNAATASESEPVVSDVNN